MSSPSMKPQMPTLWSTLGLIYVATVHNIRKSHRSPIVGLLLSIVQTSMMFLGFYLMMTFTGLSAIGLRGDFTLYLLSGIFLYMVHSAAISAVAGADGPTSNMMLHTPMNTLISVSAAALNVLYIQLLTLFVILLLYHLLVAPVQIENPVGAFTMFLMSWASGAAIGIFLFALKPWFPQFSNIVATVFNRLNMVASGKMFVANTLPAYLLPLFLWNPIFHLIDQCRGYVFINYEARVTNWHYPLYFILFGTILGLIVESYTRRHASASWFASR